MQLTEKNRNFRSNALDIPDKKGCNGSWIHELVKQ
jgi:hypothetical protein